MTDAADPKPIGRPFAPGQSGNPAGRPRGARSRLSESFLTALADDFDENGVEAIAECRLRDVVAYCRVIAAVLPKEVSVKVSELDQLGNDELDERIGAAIEVLRGGSAGSEAGAGAPARGEAAPTRPH